MTESDNDSKLDEMERDSLQKAISEVETALTVSTSGTRLLLQNFLQNAKGRVAALDKNIQQSRAEHETRKQAELAIATLAEKEAALSASEKETYSGFLGKKFFTKQDFGSLEKFYAQTWDRLSESGKDQMSHRIWEGIRRDEYKFTDLPKVVQEKESERAYSVLKKREAEVGRASRIPETDREDFIRAYESGNRDGASKVLDRKSFRENMAVSVPSNEKNAIAIAHSRNMESGRVEKGASAGLAQEGKKLPPVSGSGSDLDLTALNLDGVKMAEVPSKVSAADIPDGKTSTAKNGPSLRNG